jgi:hypothetical protein
MAIVIPSIKGKIGETEYYQATMNASDLVHRVRPASELDEWATMTVEDRLQREPDLKRVKAETSRGSSITSLSTNTILLIIRYISILFTPPLTRGDGGVINVAVKQQICTKKNRFIETKHE